MTFSYDMSLEPEYEKPTYPGTGNGLGGEKLQDEYDVIVIGSGMGGLSCGAVLSQFGERVLVLEQHEVTGGGAHEFAVEGKKRWVFASGHHITIPWHEQVLQLACGTPRPPVPFGKLCDPLHKAVVRDGLESLLQPRFAVLYLVVCVQLEFAERFGRVDE